MGNGEEEKNPLEVDVILGNSQSSKMNGLHGCKTQEGIEDEEVLR